MVGLTKGFSTKGQKNKASERSLSVNLFGIWKRSISFSAGISPFIFFSWPVSASRVEGHPSQTCFLIVPMLARPLIAWFPGWGSGCTGPAMLALWACVAGHRDWPVLPLPISAPVLLPALGPGLSGTNACLWACSVFSDFFLFSVQPLPYHSVEVVGPPSILAAGHLVVTGTCTEQLCVAALPASQGSLGWGWLAAI